MRLSMGTLLLEWLTDDKDAVELDRLRRQPAVLIEALPALHKLRIDTSSRSSTATISFSWRGNVCMQYSATHIKCISHLPAMLSSKSWKKRQVRTPKRNSQFIADLCNDEITVGQLLDFPANNDPHGCAQKLCLFLLRRAISEQITAPPFRTLLRLQMLSHRLFLLFPPLYYKGSWEQLNPTFFEFKREHSTEHKP